VILKFLLGMWFFTVSHSATCADFVVQLPAEKNSGKSNYIRDSIVYLVKAFLSPENSEEFTPGPGSVEVPEQHLPADVHPTFKSLSESKTYLELFDRFRDADFSQAYLRYQSRRQPHLVLPDERKDFEKLVGLDVAEFSSSGPNLWISDSKDLWRRKIIPVSKVKGKMRVLYRRSPKILPALSVAVTHDKEGQPTGEMEITVMRADGSGQWDFYVYSPSGKLTAESFFFTSQGTEVKAPAPYTCMACHYDTRSRTFQRFPSQFNSGRTLLFNYLLPGS
jgi:hypothetical protein